MFSSIARLRMKFIESITQLWIEQTFDVVCVLKKLLLEGRKPWEAWYSQIRRIITTSTSRCQNMTVDRKSRTIPKACSSLSCTLMNFSSIEKAQLQHKRSNSYFQKSSRWAVTSYIFSWHQCHSNSIRVHGLIMTLCVELALQVQNDWV